MTQLSLLTYLYLTYLSLSDYDYFNLHSPGDLLTCLRIPSVLLPTGFSYQSLLPADFFISSQNRYHIALCIPPYNCRLLIPGLKWFTLRARNALYI